MKNFITLCFLLCIFSLSISAEEVWVLDDDRFSKGYNVSILNASDLPSGTYMLTLNSNGNILDMKKMLIIE